MATYLQDNWFDFQLDFDSKPLPMGKWVRSRQCHWKNCLAFRFHVPSLKEAARTWKWMVERWNFLLFGMASYFQVRTVGCRVYIFFVIHICKLQTAFINITQRHPSQSKCGDAFFFPAAAEKDDPQKSRVPLGFWVRSSFHPVSQKRKDTWITKHFKYLKWRM